MSVVFRVYDDGLGFRYELPRQDNLSYFEIADEETEFVPTGDHQVWWIPAYQDDRYEYLYKKSRKIMNERQSSTHITFTENGPIDVAQLNALYRIIGWDAKGRRTATETSEMLRVSHYYIAAHTADGRLVGFARVCGDPYIVQVLDVITHPDYRCCGIATRCMLGVLAHLRRSNYVSVTLTDGSGVKDFYQRFGFRLADASTPTRVWQRRPEGVIVA